MFGMFKFITNKESLNTLDECTICMENKSLHKFCDSHMFCHNCNNEWIKKDYFCPYCRELCKNTKYMKHNITLVDYDYNSCSVHNFDSYFKQWHRSMCIRGSHNFIIQFSSNNRKIRFYCSDCNVEQLFKIQDGNEENHESYFMFRV